MFLAGIQRCKHLGNRFDVLGDYVEVVLTSGMLNTR